jgi:hypothetical protein
VERRVFDDALEYVGRWTRMAFGDLTVYRTPDNRDFAADAHDDLGCYVHPDLLEVLGSEAGG